MKKMVILLIVSLMATSAFAVVDPDPNMLGMYLDLNADVTCGPAMMGNVYVILTNPTYGEVNGAEFGFDVVGGPMFVLSTTWPLEAVAIGGYDNVSRGDWACGFAPIVTSEATVVCTMQVLPQGPTSIILTGNNIPSGEPGLPAILDAGVVTNVGLSAGIGGTAVAMGTPCEDVVATEKASFESLKSLYR